MIATEWILNNSIVPDLPANDPVFSTWVTLGVYREKWTPGGLIDRMINIAKAPLFVAFEPWRVIASIADAGQVAAVGVSMAEISSSVRTFVPGPKTAGKYPVSSPGVDVAATCTENGVDVTDVRRAVLLPVFPSYTISQLVNLLGDYGQSNHLNRWLVTMDQLTGDVCIYNRSSFSPSFPSALALAGGNPIVAFDALM